MNFNRDAAPVVFDCNRAVAIDCYMNLGRIARHRFVDGVVYDFVNQMMQAAGGVVADIHAKAFSDVVAVRQMLHLISAVLFRALSLFGVGMK